MCPRVALTPYVNMHVSNVFDTISNKFNKELGKVKRVNIYGVFDNTKGKFSKCVIIYEIVVRSNQSTRAKD